MVLHAMPRTSKATPPARASRVVATSIAISHGSASGHSQRPYRDRSAILAAAEREVVMSEQVVLNSFFIHPKWWIVILKIFVDVTFFHRSSS
jgi:hypothetical protein